MNEATTGTNKEAKIHDLSVYWQHVRNQLFNLVQSSSIEGVQGYTMSEACVVDVLYAFPKFCPS